MNDLLNTPQRSALTIRLREFEKALRQADTWLQCDEAAGILYRSGLCLSLESKANARQMIAAALGEIGELAREFELEAADNDLAATIAANLSMNWAQLCDAGSGTLQRCGEVDPRLAQKLDPHIERLAGLALSLASVIRGEKDVS